MPPPFDADYHYALEIRLVNFWNEDGDLLPDQFRKLMETSVRPKGKAVFIPQN
jgi:hypothetical protein